MGNHTVIEKTQAFSRLVISGAIVFLAFISLRSPFVQAEKVLAKINNTTITLDYFNKKYNDNAKYFQYKAPNKTSVLDDLIKRELGIQEAKKIGLDKDPEILERMNTVLFHALLERQLAKNIEKINISDSEAKIFYTKNPEIRTRHIFVSVPPGASPDEEKKAHQKIGEVQKKYIQPRKMSFAEVAQRYSEGVAAPMGGDIDYQTSDKLDPEYYQSALKLKGPGSISGIVRSQFGFHIIQMVSVRPWEKTDKAKIKRLVFEKKREDVFNSYIENLRKKSKVSINKSMLGE